MPSFYLAVLFCPEMALFQRHAPVVSNIMPRFKPQRKKAPARKAKLRHKTFYREVKKWSEL